jgi:hypothetical protein
MAKVTDEQLTEQAEVIRNETEAGANTKDRVADLLQDIIDSKPSVVDLRPVILLGGVDISGDTFPIAGGTGAGGSIEQGNQFHVTVGGTLDGEDIPVKSILQALEDAPGQDATKWRII